MYLIVGSHCRSDQLNHALSSDQGLVELTRWSCLGGLPCSASLRLPTQKFWRCPKNLSRDQEAKRSRSHREVIGYWLSRGRVDLETIMQRSSLVGIKISAWSSRPLFNQYLIASRSTPYWLIGYWLSRGQAIGKWSGIGWAEIVYWVGMTE